MSKLIIEMQNEENYDAHNGFCGSYRWKYKFGLTYSINVDLDYGDERDAHIISDLIEEVTPLITVNDNYMRSYIATWYVLGDNEDTRNVKGQKEQDPNGVGTLYLPIELKKNSKGVWFQKRGHVVGSWQEGTEWSHLVGKFFGWVDNLTTGECLFRLEGDERKPLEGGV